MDANRIETIARTADWLAHRYDPGHDAVHFRHLDRYAHRRATFATDEYLGIDRSPIVLTRQSVASRSTAGQAPLHFIFHSAFCLSTVLARAFDHPGIAMGLKEPVILNDLVGWRRRGAPIAMCDAVLRDVLGLLARPFAPDEAVVVKPSNIVSTLAAPILKQRPNTRALVLHAPLRTYLTSVAKKEMDGRLWVRGLFLGLMQDGAAEFGYDGTRLLGQTDLQIAALGWLAQHRLFHALVERFGPERVRTLDSQTLIADPHVTLTRLHRFFGLRDDRETIDAAAKGPAFASHSKTGTEFTARDRAAEYAEAGGRHSDEIAKVAIWAEQVAAHAGIPLILGAPLVA